MKKITEYIIEQLLLEEEVNKDSLLQSLNNHAGSLDEFVKALNQALKNADSGDNAKLWMGAIKDLFDGENGEDYKAKNHVAIECTKLYPTQSEIDIENSAKWITKDWGAKGVKDMFSGEPFGKSFPVPVLVYQNDGKYWIIDGHHRWSQVGLINRNAKLDCLVVSGPESAQDFLKITQGIIAAVIADENNKNNGKGGSKQLPVGKANPDNNIFGDALKGEKLKERIIKMCNENESNAKILYANIKECMKTDKEVGAEEIGNLVMNNRNAMIEAKQTPPDWAAPRPVMPQSDAAGPNNPDDAKDGNPENTGSALNIILKKHKFPNIG